MWKVIIFVFFVLYFAYLVMALGQAFGLIKITNRKITVRRMLIPFYYWIAPVNEKSEKKQTGKSNN